MGREGRGEGGEGGVTLMVTAITKKQSCRGGELAGSEAPPGSARPLPLATGEGQRVAVRGQGRLYVSLCPLCCQTR